MVVYKLDQYSRSIFAHPVTQTLLLLAVLYHYLIGIYPIPDVLTSILFSFIYGCIFVNLSSIPNPTTTLEIQPFIYLGEISFGLYIYHMFADYILRAAFQHIHTRINPVAFSTIYLLPLLTITIAVAAVSHHFFEAFFLNLRKRYKRN